ncbi:MAG: 50S ribosomal protein L1 [Candidatus Diapherotrites archaeon]|nr:50S ribosomal protein L1 [Candidatus Diapherotrites archaeon]
MKLKEAIEKAKTASPKRKFTQTVDLAINFRNIDFTKPENRLNMEVVLPKGKGKEVKICVICGDELASNAKGVVDKIIKANEIEEYGKNKKKLKKIANEFDFFIAEAPLMPQIGKLFGQVLGPRGKMPKPVPPGANIKPIVERLKKTIIIRTKGKYLPVIHAPIGTEVMPVDDLVENAMAVINAVKDKLPDKEGNIKSIFVKTTMGPSVKVEM